MPLVFEGKNTLASENWLFMVIAEVDHYTWGTRSQFGQENLKKYVEPIHATEICKGNEFRQQK